MPAKKQQRSKRLASYGLLILNTFCWGAALIIVKPAFDTTTPFRFLFYRYAIASILVIPLLWRYSKKIKSIWQKIRIIAPIEIFGITISLSLLYLGLAKTGAIEASLITTTTPIWVVIGGILFLKEKEQIHELFGLLLAIVGTVLLILSPLVIDGIHNGSGLSISGNLLVLLGVVTTAGYYLLAKKNYQKIPKMFVASVSFVVATISLLPIAWWESSRSSTNLLTNIQHDWTDINVAAAAIYMAVFGSIIGLTAYIKGQDGIEASEAGLFTYLQPLIYLPLGFIFLGERIFSVQILSLIIILIGVAIAEKRVRQH